MSLQNLSKYSIIIFDKIDYELNNILCRRVALNLFTSNVKTTPPQKKVAGIVLERGRTTHFSTIARAQRWSMDKHASSWKKRRNKLEQLETREGIVRLKKRSIWKRARSQESLHFTIFRLVRRVTYLRFTLTPIEHVPGAKTGGKPASYSSLIFNNRYLYNISCNF